MKPIQILEMTEKELEELKDGIKVIDLNPINIKMKPIQTLETMTGLSIQNILTRAVRRLNQSKSSGLIKDYKIHHVANHYFYEIIE